MTENYDVIIIGSGIIGNSTAAHLASENLKVAVINSTSLGMPASVAAAGLYQLQLGELENSAVKDFCCKSFEYFQTFYETIRTSTDLSNIDLGFNQCGSLYLIFSNTEIAQKENELKELKAITSNVLFLNKQEIFKYEPGITKETLGAYHYPDEGFINNPKFLKAISAYCLERKITFLNTEVTNIKIENNNVERIELANGENIKAKKYVLCNGVWANNVLKKLFNTNENIINGIKGQMLQVLLPEEASLKKVIFCHDGYIVPRPATNKFEKQSLLVGGTYEEVNIEENNDVFKNTVSGIYKLTALLQRLLPGYKDYPIINFWSGIRPQAKDNLPILGGMEEIQNIYFALGHYRNGILMGPLTGKILKDMILGNTLEYNINPFKINRLLKTSNSPSKSNGRVVVKY
ncbi:MAG: FAD-dependent oxidoreductase [Candidatus Melainabacteria bacterium]|nr:FAD-dependent oxidoreductase [Candidatus Melainabacteria bacterium]